MYDRRQLKNIFDVLRKDWKLWEKLMSGETGIGYDAATNRVLASDEWWQRKILPDTEEEEDVYRVGLDQQEGSRDSEDENFGVDPTASAGFTDDFAACNINNPASTGPSSSGSYGKRKRGETSDAKKKKKVAASTLISDSMSVIAAASDKRAAALVEDPQVVDKVLAHLTTVEELNDDNQLYYACAKMLTLLRWARRAYLGFMHDRTKLLAWLIPAAQDPDTWK
ncbi:uncharacterized protein LOC114729232 [Neltuma alba]|uniref:uncharacterized protein LOC114729232 n=1 Tax=Neltuma alba TaxID=207710 RepID=UPI0010A4AE56|nr:uncharacterized protein LOC114729232 [Prosopis alba]